MGKCVSIHVLYVLTITVIKMVVLTDAKVDIIWKTILVYAKNVHMGVRIAQIEKQILRDALQENAHNQRRTATALGLSYDQLRGMVRKYKLSERQH